MVSHLGKRITLLDLIGENGTIHSKTDGATWLRGRVNDTVKRGSFKNQVNTEAKNFILKVENEVRRKYESA